MRRFPVSFSCAKIKRSESSSTQFACGNIPFNRFVIHSSSIWNPIFLPVTHGHTTVIFRTSECELKQQKNCLLTRPNCQLVPDEAKSRPVSHRTLGATCYPEKWFPRTSRHWISAIALIGLGASFFCFQFAAAIAKTHRDLQKSIWSDISVTRFSSLKKIILPQNFHGIGGRSLTIITFNEESSHNPHTQCARMPRARSFGTICVIPGLLMRRSGTLKADGWVAAGAAEQRARTDTIFQFVPFRWVSECNCLQFVNGIVEGCGPRPGDN